MYIVMAGFDPSCKTGEIQSLWDTETDAVRARDLCQCAEDNNSSGKVAWIHMWDRRQRSFRDLLGEDED